MIDFEKARSEAFKGLKRISTVSILTEREKKEADLTDSEEVWRVSTEIFTPIDKVETVDLHICFSADFPLSLPKVNLSKKDYAWIKYIPHVNSAPNICLFDNETIKVDPSEPFRIVKECIDKAKRIITDGLFSKGAQDYKEEFIAYWEDTYDAKDKVENCLSLLSATTPISGGEINYLYLPTPFRDYSFVLIEENDAATNFKAFLERFEHKYEVHQALYLGEVDTIPPPFFLTNNETLQFIQTHFPSSISKLERFIEHKDYPKVVVFSMVINGQRLFFGWFYKPFHTIRKGYRSTALTNLDIFKTFQKLDSVTRLKFEEFTFNRLQKRTDGIAINTKKYNFAFAGLGSIGSNLLHFLQSLETEHITLIDPELLTLENINRHLIGLYAVKESKAEALKSHLLFHNPFLNISTYSESIVKLLRTQLEVLNSHDYLFIAIGKDNIEEYLIDTLNSELLKTPIFILWVEPYLLGGHLLYINPKHRFDLKQIHSGGSYKFNIIDDSVYKDSKQQILLREAGCQASYVPYGQKSINLFLASIFPDIVEVIEKNSTQNFAITWKGNEQLHASLQLKLSAFSSEIHFGEKKVTVFE